MIVEIGERLKEARTELGFRQEEVSEFVGIKQGQLSAFESGSRAIGVATLAALAEIYGTSLDYLISGDEKKKPNSVKMAYRASGISKNDIQKVLWARRLLDAYKELLSL